MISSIETLKKKALLYVNKKEEAKEKVEPFLLTIMENLSKPNYYDEISLKKKIKKLSKKEIQVLKTEYPNLTKKDFKWVCQGKINELNKGIKKENEKIEEKNISNESILKSFEVYIDMFLTPDNFLKTIQI